MFSGLRSILFGYSDSVNPSTSGSNESSVPNEGSKDASAILEQTLNAATTKLTEQLLPTSPSIEQLQSSNHQLLPSLNEQHEENELKKQKISQIVEQKIVDDVDNDDEDGIFNPDSWELLDLVEKPEASVSLNSTVHKEVIDNRSSNGILKKIDNKASQDFPALTQSDRQKPKVSFETPDLVNAKQTIEQNKPKDYVKLKGKNRKQNKKTKIAPQKEILGSKIELDSSSEKSTEKQLQSNATVLTPVLNYAAALSATKSTKVTKNTENEKPAKGSSLPTEISMHTSGAVKRIRPVSTSSWSSSDELENSDLSWKDMSKTVEKVEKKRDENEIFDFVNEDAESIISSGFSDCDYGYHGINDYIMRPKKVQNKKRAGQGTLNTSKTRRELERESNDAKKVTENVELNGQKKNTDCKFKISPKQMKPKKKKMNTISFYYSRESSSSANRISESSLIGPSDSLTNLINKSKTTLSPPSNNETTSMSKNATALMPPPSIPNTMASSCSGNDSSDIAEMDESWFVTPPPCFTGSNKSAEMKSKNNKEAARENALIEHPSVYIASTSKQMKHVNAGQTMIKCEKQDVKATNSLSELASSAKPHTADLTSYNGKKTKSESNNSQVHQFTLSQAPIHRQQSSNKFFLEGWDVDDDELDNWADYEDYLYSQSRKKSTERKKVRPEPKVSKQKVGKQKSVAYPAVLMNEHSVELGELPDELKPDFLNDMSPALVGLTDSSSESSSAETLTKTELDGDENVEVSVKIVSTEDTSESEGIELSQTTSFVRRNKSSCEKKAPVSVQPIEPERQPGWQLRKKRSKRRPLSSSLANSNGLASGARVQQAEQKMPVSTDVERELQIARKSGRTKGNMSTSNSSSARSTPNLIDRIGSTIVANLTNLTNGFTSPSISMPTRSLIGEAEKLNQSVVRKSCAFETNVVTSRRNMSRGYLDRQNDCAKLANSNRRADRRLKMHSTPNGYSVNRKVHTSFH